MKREKRGNQQGVRASQNHPLLAQAAEGEERKKHWANPATQRKEVKKRIKKGINNEKGMKEC
jgi:hypothetical protein